MNYLKTTILLATLSAMLIFVGGLIGGKGGMIIALGIAGAMNFISYWWSDKIVLMMYGAKVAPEGDFPELYRIVRTLTARVNMPMPKVYVMDMDTPNAFATGRNPEHAAVAVTTGIMKLLNKEELSGVIGHELAHIRNRDILIGTIAATIAGAISYLSQMAYYASLFGGGDRDGEDRGSNPIVAIVMMIVAPIAAMIIQMAISRSREYGADNGGAEIAGNPIYLASALKKLDYYGKALPMEQATQSTAHMFIVSPLSGGSLFRLFSTHPPVEERVRRLEAMAGIVSQS